MKYLMFLTVIILASCFSSKNTDQYNDPTKLANQARVEAGMKPTNQSTSIYKKGSEVDDEVTIARKALNKAGAENDMSIGRLSDAELRLSNYCMGDGYLVSPQTIAEYYDKFLSAASVYENKLQALLSAKIAIEKIQVAKNIETYKVLHKENKDTRKKLIQKQKDYLEGTIEELERKTELELKHLKERRKSMKELTKMSANVKKPERKAKQ